MPRPADSALFDDALKLPPDDRLALATELLHSIEDPDPSWSEAWASEIARRIQELDEGQAKAIPWSEVRAELEARLVSQ